MVNLPYAGHTNPSPGLACRLVAAGHEVDYIQTEAFREQVEANGACFVPYDKPPHSSAPVLNETRNQGTAYRTVRRIDVSYDCLTYEPLFSPGETLVAKLDILCYRLTSTPTLNRHLLRVLGKTGGPYLAVLFRSDRLHALVGHLFLPRFSLWEENLAGVLVREAPPHNFIYTLRGFQPEETNFLAVHYHFMGLTIEDGAEEALSFGESGNLIIYISFGTPMHTDERFWKKLIRTLTNKRVEMVCSVGSEKLTRSLRSLPPSMRVFPRVPQLTLLRHTALFVTRGGMNSVNKVLYHDIPMIVLPSGLDQPLVGQEPAQHKPGRLIAPQELTFARPQRTAKKLLRDPGVRKARLTAKRKMQASNGNREMTRCILEDLAIRDIRGATE